jgi:hypothetical protein
VLAAEEVVTRTSCTTIKRTPFGSEKVACGNAQPLGRVTAAAGTALPKNDNSVVSGADEGGVDIEILICFLAHKLQTKDPAVVPKHVLYAMLQGLLGHASSSNDPLQQ